MKRCLLTAAALALLPTVVHAQGATTPVTVSIQGDASLIRTGTTSFGTIGNGARTVTINPVAPNLDQTTAQFTASGSPHAQISVTFDASVMLCPEPPGCEQGIPFTADVSHHDIEQYPQGWSSPGLATGTAVALNAQGHRFFWLGGSIAVAANQPIGVYKGDFTMRVTYQ
jgi:hypothetical protein